MAGPRRLFDLHNLIDSETISLAHRTIADVEPTDEDNQSPTHALIELTEKPFGPTVKAYLLSPIFWLCVPRNKVADSIDEN